MKTKVLAAIASSTMLFTVGCSQLPSMSKNPAEPIEQSAVIASEDMNKDSTQETGSDDLADDESFEMFTTVRVRLTDENVLVDYKTIDAGPVSFDIFNNSQQPEDVVLLKTNLPVDEIPINVDNVDLSNEDFQQVGRLTYGPIPVDGLGTITKTLDPGQYVLMVYAPGNVEAAKTQTILLTEPDVPSSYQNP
jgi:hypothetical protein